MNKAQLRPHQIKAISELTNGKILCGDVGSGKSRTALAYFLEKTDRTRIVIITTAKKRDTLEWNHEAALFGISSDPETDTEARGRHIVVDSWNNIRKYQAEVGSAFIFDEQRLVGSGAWVKSFLDIARKNSWILLSATPGDTWLDYIPVFVANGFYKNRSEFKREHVIYNHYSKFPKVDRYVGQKRLRAYRDALLVEMPVSRHTRRNDIWVMVDYDPVLFKGVWKQRWNPWTEKPIRTMAELFFAMRRIVNEDPSRIKAIRELIEKHPRLIIFYNFDYELEILRALCDEMRVVYAEHNGHKHELVPTGDSWVYLVQYLSGAEAWNCIETDSMAFYSLNYSWRLWHQAKGRIDRLNTDFVDLRYYTLRSRSPIDVAIVRALTAKKNFNERSFVKGNLNEQN